MWQGKAAVYGEDALKLVRLNGIESYGVRYHKLILTAKTITFYIVDHGLGIAEQDKPYIFDRFYCADKSHTNKSHFGLGLNIADELSKILNGKVGFNDTIGGGATFYITIPLK